MLFKHLKSGVSCLWIFAMCIVIAQPDSDPMLEQIVDKYGAQAGQTLTNWRSMLERNHQQSEQNKLLVVNDFFNNTIQFFDDSLIWNEPDYWATPLETMGRQQGDCEDFTIAKYISLIKLGVPVAKMRLVYVKANTPGLAPQAHMVLAYYATPDSEPLILDNINKNIVRASKRVDLTPVYSFNSAGLWLPGSAEAKLKNPETRMSKWRDVLARMQNEGFDKTQ